MFNMDSNGYKLIACLHFVIILLIRTSHGLHFTKSSTTYAMFPRWDACANASISFEFRTRSADVMLLYTDDNGNFDYVEITLKSGSVRLRMNIVDGRDGSEEITLGQRLHDDRWHRVELRRNRMESTLYVDSEQSSKVAFGSDFNFGSVSTNNFVYFGGLPESYYNPDQNQNGLPKLSLPSAYFETRFDGDIRNVFYGNCSCKLSRGEMVRGESVSREPAEACEKANTCDPACLCVSRDDGAGCQCKGLECHTDQGSYYRLPMDEVLNDKLVNPSGLDAVVTGNPQIVPGVVGRALKIDEKFQKIKVSGPGHRNECFGDLELCPQGYTLALWVRFDEPGPGNGVYISNGAQSDASHGVAMLYQIGRLEWIFKTKGTSHVWRVTAGDILPRHWYHVTVTWQADEGLALFINGNKVARSGSPMKVTPTTHTAYNDFIIGQSNDGSGSSALGTMTIDEFQFWAKRLEDETLREKGPIYSHHISMDQFDNGQLVVPFLEPSVIGSVRQVPGKIGNALELPGRNQYIDLGLFSGSCLGNTSLCMYGFTVAFWINFKDLKDNAYYMASGFEGFTVYSNQRNLYVTVQEGERKWLTYTSGLQTGTWYFLEISWSRTSGLRLYVNRMLTAMQSRSVHQPISETLINRFYVGKANSHMYYERYGAFLIDEIEMFNAEREGLIAIDFILRGLPLDDAKWTVNDPTSWPNVTYEDLVDYLVMAKAYDGKAMKSFRSLYAYNYVQNGWLGDIMWCSHNNIQYLKAKVSPSQPGVGRADYMAWAAIGDDSSILTGYCTCPAGTGRSCSHISAIIYAVTLAWSHGLAGQTCTDKDRLWGRGAGTAVLHEAFENIKFDRPKPDDAPIVKKTQKKITGTQLPKISSFLDHSELQEHARESCTNKLWTCKGTMLQKILSAKERPVNELKSVEHSDHTIDPSRSVNEVNCLPCDAFYQKYINISAEAKTDISEATSSQCSTLWSDARKLWISSSRVHALPKTNRADPNKFVTNQIYPRFKGNSATQHGQKHEAEARAWFEHNAGIKVTQTGVVIDQTEPYLAASPDGLVGKDTIVEIKCPTKPLRELIQSGKYDVVNTKLGGHCLNPKGRNGYYTQVQIAMHCTARHNCKFVVWTKDEGLIVDVPYDANFVRATLARIREFYFKHLIVRLVDEHNFKRLMISDEYKHYC